MRKVTTPESVKTTPNELASQLLKDRQLLLPCLDLVLASKLAADELINLAGQAVIQAILELSASEVAGPPHQGVKGGDIRRHGHQAGQVSLSDRKLEVRKPRLRHKEGGENAEVEVPAYTAMRDNERLGQRVLELLLLGVSTRNYAKVLPEMAGTVGVSKSAISRHFVEATAEKLEELRARDFKNEEILVIYLDGIIVGEHHVIVALGVTRSGHKKLLGLQLGSSENSVVVRDLLTGIVERGVSQERKYLFVIDGSKALAKGVREVFGEGNPIQRCRNHKVINVLSYLPDDRKDQVLTTMKAAFRLDAKEGKQRLRKLASWLEQDHPDAAGSLREGLEEMFTINELGLSARLRRCLGTTNLIEQANGEARRGMRRVTRWQEGTMVLRWSAGVYLEAEGRFRRIMGHQDLWQLASKLGRNQVASGQEAA